MSGVRLRVRVTPRAGRDRLEGVIALPDGPAVKIAVSAPPEDGKANAAARKLLARFFRTAPSNIAVVSGAMSRVKRVEIAGDGAALAAVLDAWAAATSSGGGAKKGSSG
ncbi:MAG: DUF167 domain-containing protein [Proteobacteria bacterium]|nr:DUF167 domain-containing protein [Pseudomonadota bacterium]